MIDYSHINTPLENDTVILRGILGNNPINAPALRLIVDEIFYATQGGPFNTRTLASRVEQDLPLSEKILEICNSPYYAGKNAIKNILQVIQRLGPTGFHCITMQAYLEIDIFSQEGPWSPTLEQLKQYSISVAHISRIISRTTNLHGDTAFLCGLLHRIGQAISILNFPDPIESPILATELWTSVELLHPIISNLIATQWGMDEDVQDSLQHYGLIYANGTTNKLTAIILIAEHITRKIGLQIQPPIRKKTGFYHTHPQNTVEEAQRSLHLSDKDIESIVSETRMVFHSLQLKLS